MSAYFVMAETKRYAFPGEFEIEGDKAILRKESDRLIVEPVRKGQLLTLLSTLKPIDEPFASGDEELAPLDDAEL